MTYAVNQLKVQKFQGPRNNFEIVCVCVCVGGGGGGGTIIASVLGAHKTLFLTNSL